MSLTSCVTGSVRAGTRETRFAGAAVPNYFRTPYRPGWALVGDAGYNGALASGASATFGFLGSSTGTNPVPSPITCTPR